VSKHVSGLLFAAVVALFALPARADDIRDEMHGYYAGERTSAILIGSLGAASIAGGIVLVTRPEDLPRGFGVPLIALGALEGLGALFYAFQVGSEIRHYDESYAKDRAAFRKEEIAHLKGTRGRFVLYLLVEATLFATGAGIAIGGFAANQDVLKGVGLGIASIAAPFLIIDSINNARAGAYADALQKFDPSVAISGRGFSVGYSGRF
jgi:hypothetical protein